ncbi:MAG: hypothetical protein M4579_006300 [Chaenotheca gracillima]|nr:MAG: hypothetical protein M4579_006300 [Chaenotheca gracillima]
MWFSNPARSSRVGMLAALIIVLLHPILTFASSLTVSPPSNVPTLPASSTATLTTLGKTYTARITRANVFRFTDLSPGSYLLDVHCRDYFFAPLRVDVTEPASGAEDDKGKVEVWQTFRGNEWDNKGELRRERPVGLLLVSPKEYYVQREGFSPLSLLKNPMILLAGFSMLIIFGMPYLLENMDPETRAEFEESQKKSAVGRAGASGQNPLQGFDMAAWMAGSSSSGGARAEEPPTSPPVRQGGGNARSGQGKKGR